MFSQKTQQFPSSMLTFWSKFLLFRPLPSLLNEKRIMANMNVSVGVVRTKDWKSKKIGKINHQTFAFSRAIMLISRTTEDWSFDWGIICQQKQQQNQRLPKIQSISLYSQLSENEITKIVCRAALRTSFRFPLLSEWQKWNYALNFSDLYNRTQ